MKKASAERISRTLAWQTPDQAGLTTAPERMQRVQALTRTVLPLLATMRTHCRLGSQRRRVLLWAWLTLFPVDGPLPQISQLRAMSLFSSNVDRFTKADNNTPEYKKSKCFSRDSFLMSAASLMHSPHVPGAGLGSAVPSSGLGLISKISSGEFHFL